MSLTIPDQSIALQAQAPNPLNSLGNIMNIANSAQALKKSQATFDADVSQRSAESQSAQAAAQVNTANAQPLIDQQAASTSTSQTGAQAAQFKLHQDYANVANQTATGLLSDPRITGTPGQPYDPEQVTKALSEAQEAMVTKGVPKEQALLATAPFVMAVHQPGQVLQMLKNTVLGSQSASQQTQSTQPNIIQNTAPSTAGGQQTVSSNTNPYAQGGVGAQPIEPIPMTLPLSQRQGSMTDQTGHSVLTNLDPYTGKVTSTEPLPGAANGRSGGAYNLPPGETPDTLKVVQGIRANANSAAASAPDQQFNNNQIIKYAGETNTGKGAQLLADMKGGYAALPYTSDSTTNLQLLGHAMAQQQGALAQSSGLTGSNAKLDLVGEQTSKEGWTQDAIQSSARTMRALGSTGAQLYNQGIENAVSTGNPFAARTFQNQWSQTANVDSLRLYDAVKNKQSDPTGVKQVVDSMGGPQSARYQFAIKKIPQMQALISGQQQ